MNNPTPSMSSMPSMTAAGSNVPSSLPLFTPPQTPGGSGAYIGNASSVVAGVKRESVASDASEDGTKEKRRRIAPTLVEVDGASALAPPRAPESNSDSNN
jgi:chromatin assembly factor 1 subunit B